MTTTQIIPQTIIKSSRTSMINSPSPNQFSKSSTKRMYESLFRIIDFEEPQPQLSDDFQNTNGIKVNSYLTDQNVLSHLYQRMKAEGVLDHYPILKICCGEITNYSENYILNCNKLYELDLNDIISTFSKLGDLNKIVFSLDAKVAYAFYNTFHTAYATLKLLDGLQFPGKMAKLHIEWGNHFDYQSLIPHFGIFLNSINWNITYKYCCIKQENINNQNYYQNQNLNQNYNQNQNSLNQKQNKLTRRYQIQIENQKQFQVARRIIGSKGCHMKKIIEESLQYAKTTDLYQINPKYFQNINELLKLRLRGKGSGYKQGPEQQESEQTLHLCVSAKDEFCFKYACEKVQKLLQSVYSQYYEYTLQQGNPIQFLINKNSISTISNNTNNFIQIQNQIKQNRQIIELVEFNQFDGQLSRIPQNRIFELLELRNKARRQLNFLEADRIRNFLRNCGVCLIDEKGRRGRANEVTSWKYLC